MKKRNQSRKPRILRILSNEEAVSLRSGPLVDVAVNVLPIRKNGNWMIVSEWKFYRGVKRKVKKLAGGNTYPSIIKDGEIIEPAETIFQAAERILSEESGLVAVITLENLFLAAQYSSSNTEDLRVKHFRAFFAVEENRFIDNNIESEKNTVDSAIERLWLPEEKVCGLIPYGQKLSLQYFDKWYKEKDPVVLREQQC